VLAYVDRNYGLTHGQQWKLLLKLVKNVHLSGGVGIGGVLEPLQAACNIEDCIGSRCIVVEGVCWERSCSWC
jgi:2,3,4,5-tetrahydropyridine-2-carboxylate N-succinyltransferase